MAILTLRLVKGSPLTHAEADDNFTNLNNELATKLNSSAYTASDVLAKLLTVDGTGSGLDADLLDGQSSAYYTDIAARLGFTPVNKAGDSMTGNLVVGSGVLNRRTAQFANTGGDVYVGVENSTGGGVFTGSSAYAAIFGTANARAVQIATSGLVCAEYAANGNYGLGITPAVRFHMKGDGFQYEPAANSNNIRLRIAGGGSDLIQFGPTAAGTLTSMAVGMGALNGALGGVWETYPDGRHIFYGASGALRIQVSATGDVGFGTVPAARLHAYSVNDEVARFAVGGATGNPFISWFQDTTRRAYIQKINGSSWLFMHEVDQPIVFGVNGSNRWNVSSAALYPALDNTYNAGTSSFHIADVFAVRIRRDSTGGIDINANNASGNVRLIANGNIGYTLTSVGKSQFGGGAYTTTNSQAFSATPTFDANLSNVFEFSGAMTANVTSCTINNPSNGQTIRIRVIQDGTGGRTFAAPAGAKIVGSVGSTAGAASILTLTYSAASARWEGSWLNLPV